MKKLANREEQIMQAFWILGNAYIKDIITQLPSPKPHYNSVATMVRILEEKGFLNHETFGNTFRYFPIISKEDYQKHAMGDFVRQYFDNSYSRMLIYFAKEQKLSKSEFDEIRALVEKSE